MSDSSHQPVLLKEVLDFYASVQLHLFIDGTLGAGGHAQALLGGHPEIERFLGIDQDRDALAIARPRLEAWQDKTILKLGNFDQFDRYLQEFSLPSPDGILVDLGVSSMQLDQPTRGFSFTKEGPLDMRMNREADFTAADIVNSWSEKELGRIFRDYGEEKQWKAATSAVVKARAKRPIVTTGDLTTILLPVLERHAKRGIHPATLVFQALRIAVNKELEVLETFLLKAIALLAPGGRLAVISFHSLEDRIVKTHMRLAASDKWETSGLGGLFRDKKPTVKIVTKKPIEASEEEKCANPRSRSAKLRVVEKLCNC